MTKVTCILFVFGFAGIAFAQSDDPAAANAPVPPSAAADIAAPQATSADAVVLKSQVRAAPAERNCLKETGSRIPAGKNRCNPVNGRAYSRDDLDRTGAPTIGEALQHLDPAITIRH